MDSISRRIAKRPQVDMTNPSSAFCYTPKNWRSDWSDVEKIERTAFRIKNSRWERIRCRLHAHRLEGVTSMGLLCCRSADIGERDWVRSAGYITLRQGYKYCSACTMFGADDNIFHKTWKLTYEHRPSVTLLRTWRLVEGWHVVNGITLSPRVQGLKSEFESAPLAISQPFKGMSYKARSACSRFGAEERMAHMHMAWILIHKHRQSVTLLETWMVVETWHHVNGIKVLSRISTLKNEFESATIGNHSPSRVQSRSPRAVVLMKGCYTRHEYIHTCTDPELHHPNWQARRNMTWRQWNHSNAEFHHWRTRLNRLG